MDDYSSQQNREHNTGKGRIWFLNLLDCNLYYVQFSTITTTTQNEKAHKRNKRIKRRNMTRA